MDIHRVEAVVETGNDDSTKLLKKLNFIYERTLADSEIKNGKFISLQYWAITKQITESFTKFIPSFLSVKRDNDTC
jgi:ribosomal-protein-alanine N-acetyltransferase